MLNILRVIRKLESETPFVLEDIKFNGEIMSFIVSDFSSDSGETFYINVPFKFVDLHILRKVLSRVKSFEYTIIGVTVISPELSTLNFTDLGSVRSIIFNGSTVVSESDVINDLNRIERHDTWVSTSINDTNVLERVFEVLETYGIPINYDKFYEWINFISRFGGQIQTNFSFSPNNYYLVELKHFISGHNSSFSWRFSSFSNIDFYKEIVSKLFGGSRVKHEFVSSSIFGVIDNVIVDNELLLLVDDFIYRFKYSKRRRVYNGDINIDYRKGFLVYDDSLGSIKKFLNYFNKVFSLSTSVHKFYYPVWNCLPESIFVTNNKEFVGLTSSDFVKSNTINQII